MNTGNAGTGRKGIRMIKSFIRRFQNSPLRHKYLIAVLLLLITTAISGAYLFSRNTRAAQTSFRQDVRSDMTDIYNEISRFEKRMTHLSTIVQNNETALDLLNRIQTLDLQSFESVRQRIMPVLYAILDGSGDYDCKLYVKAMNDFIDSSSRIQLFPEASEEAWAAEAMEGWGWRQFYTPSELHASSPALLAPIRDTEHVLNLIGLLRIDLNPAALQRMITPVRSGAYVTCYIESPDGEVIARSGVQADLPDYLSGLSSSEKTGFGSTLLHEVPVQEDTLLYQRLPVSGWMVAMVLRQDLLSRRIRGEQAEIILVGILMILLGVLCALPILAQAVRRIQRFHTYVQRYNDAGLDDIPPRLEPLAHDEIGELIESHNAMLDHIQQLIREKSRQEKEMRRLEIFALQAQIKPHFLYNTLEAIGWMSRLRMPDKVDSTIRSLTAFYRLCLSSGKDILPVEKELEIVRNYFAVACMRYDSQYTLETDVEEAALDIPLPKLTLQPLVENALMHGLLESGQSGGTIRVYTRRNAAQAPELCVADSGAHFSRQAWTRILRNDESYGSDGYGLKNVEKRLCLYYNRPEVLQLDLSSPDWSIIVIPLVSSPA